MSKQILKVHISWKNERTFYIDTNSAMTTQEIERYVALLKEVVEREITEYNKGENIEDNVLYDFIMKGSDALFPLPPQSKCNVTSVGNPFDVEVEWNAHDSAFENWEFPE